MDEKNPSVLDNVPVNNKAFPLNEQHPVLTLEIVGACPHCGAPIYGAKRVHLQQDQAPVVRYSCSCFRRQGVFEQVMETK